jgi:(2R)-3-sulfolactate dehydrogenase (NADP+)
MEGSMLPLGGAKGAMLALVVEILVTALTGAHFGGEASSFFEDAGNRPRIGQAFILVNPGGLAGRDVYDERIEALIAAMLADEGVRMPGARRLAAERRAREEGIELPAGW